MPGRPTAELSEYCDSIADDSLPREVVERTKDLFVDWAGVTLRGTVVPSSRTMAAVAERLSTPAPIDAALLLRDEYRVTPAGVRRLRVKVGRGGWDVVAHPVEEKRRPANVVQAQFSTPFGVAVALVRGRAGFDEYPHQRQARIDLIFRLELLDDVRAVGRALAGAREAAVA